MKNQQKRPPWISSQGARTSILLFTAAIACGRQSTSQPSDSTRTGGASIRILSEEDLWLGQLLFLGLPGHVLDKDSAQLIREIQPGGIVFYRWNLRSPTELARLIEAIQRLYPDSRRPFLAIDQEGGNVARLRTPGVLLPGNMALGATRSPILAERAGFEQARALRALGLNMNFGPVLEPITNPNSPVIGIRSFSSDPGLVTNLGSAFIRGQESAGIATVAKHFPGHFDSITDSHWTVPSIDLPDTEVRRLLRPFDVVIRQGLDALMTAHVAVPALDATGSPATFSGPVLTELLRNRMKFDGLVVSDALSMMGLVRTSKGLHHAALSAIRAGSDMVLIPSGPQAAVARALAKALKDGDLDRQRAMAALRRVLDLKERRRILGPFQSLKVDVGQTSSNLGLEIARKAVTVLSARRGSLFLPRSGRIEVITSVAELGDMLASSLPEQVRTLRLANANEASGSASVSAVDPALLESIRLRARHADMVVIGIINEDELPVFEAARRLAPRLVAISFGRPALLERMRTADLLIAAYSYVPEAGRAVASLLLGDIIADGRLPVALERFPFGSGLKVQLRRPEARHARTKN